MGREKRFIIFNFKNIYILGKWSPSFPLLELDALKQV
jgi:hypothetical protein